MMKTKSKLYKSARLFAVLGLISLMSCESYMRNPLVDKDSGENIKLLIVDLNFIRTKMAIHLKDLTSGAYIEGEEVEIIFFGDDASNLITFTGTKPDKFTTDKGIIEVGWDPNIPISEESPIELTVMARSKNYVSAPMAVSYTSEGLKDVLIKMVYTGIKSGSTSAFNEPFDLKFNDVVNSSDLSFIADISALPTGTSYDYLNNYLTLASGQLVSENITDPLIYSDFGVYYVAGSGGLTPPSLPSKNVSLQAGTSVYTTVQRTGVETCSQGLTLNVSQAGGAEGSASLDYLITFSDGTTQEGIISGTFPISIEIENIYYPSTDASVSVEIFGDAQYNISEKVNLASACGNTANFTATKKDGLDSYKFIIRYSCAGANTSAALTIGGEFRKVGSSGGWTRFQFNEGITYLQLVKNEDYDFRILIDNDAYEYVLPTNPDRFEQYLIDNQSDDFYTIKTLTITEGTEFITINGDVELAGDVCDIIN